MNALSFTNSLGWAISQDSKSADHTLWLPYKTPGRPTPSAMTPDTVRVIVSLLRQSVLPSYVTEELRDIPDIKSAMEA